MEAAPSTEPPLTTQPEPTPTTEPPTPAKPEPPTPEPLVESPCTSATVADQSLEALIADCEALWDFYRFHRSQLGGFHDSVSAWGPDTTLGDWRGVTLTEGRVTALDVEFEPDGEIADSLGSLTALERLVLVTPAEGPGWLGPLPEWLGNLTNLEVLRMGGLEGSIPPELGNLTNLRELDLAYGRLSGQIPPELGNLTNLHELRLVGNELSGPIPPELGNLTNLTSLELTWNDLSGPVPPELANLTNLAWLELASNDLSGPIPPELGNLTNLTSLTLASNDLSGPIPPWLGDLTNLRHLSLGRNRLTGPIPDLASLTKLRFLLAHCQWPVGSAQWRTVELPSRGQQNCPVVARCSAHSSVG